jgi:phosphoribosylaminoimidazolecarboxamide formyltransferase/IMP cyclohydrolase
MTTGRSLAELRSDGNLCSETRRRLARAAFAHTAAYDAAIVGWFDEDAADELPESIHLALKRVQDLRYGENPHQVGARYCRWAAPGGGTEPLSTVGRQCPT